MTELALDELQDLCSRNIHTAGNNSQNDGVVLVQLRVGIDVRLLHGGGAVELPVVAVYSTVIHMASDIVL